MKIIKTYNYIKISSENLGIDSKTYPPVPKAVSGPGQNISQGNPNTIDAIKKRWKSKKRKKK